MLEIVKKYVSLHRELKFFTNISDAFYWRTYSKT